MVEAKASLRKIEVAEKGFKNVKGRYGSLEELASAGLLKEGLAKGSGNGYRFVVRVKPDSYEALAIPDKSLDENLLAFYLDDTGILRQNLKATEANRNDEPAPDN